MQLERSERERRKKSVTYQTASFKVEIECGVSERTSVTRRRNLAAGDEKLKSERHINVEIQKLQLQCRTQTHGGFKVDEPCKHGTALVHHWVSYPYVDQPSQQIHARPELYRVHRARRLSRMRRRRQRESPGWELGRLLMPLWGLASAAVGAAKRRSCRGGDEEQAYDEGSINLGGDHHLLY